MNNVHLCSPTNSTIFTDCCNVAILDHQTHCPVCKEEVYPGEAGVDFWRRTSRWNMAYGQQRRQYASPPFHPTGNRPDNATHGPDKEYLRKKEENDNGR